MIKIGIVGDIGAGKSFIARQFGYPVFDADKQVSKIYKENNNCFKKLKKKLPNFIKSFPIKKKELKKAVLNNKKNLKKIENIVHPEVQKYMKKFIKLNKNKKILIFDIPLLIENKIYNKKKMVLVFVDAKKKDINKKLRKRKNYDEKIIKKLRKFQLPLEIKKKKSNYLIKNDFKSLNLRKRVKILKNKILNANE
jgi:dephospho-CoA kinase|tara:strand:+ start:114 stop:698 length:585 start_codon:yes stop_codon:yes gene_type:complete